MRYDLLVADFDGTLGVAPDVIEKQTVEAIKRFQEKGGYFSIVTGRSYTSIKSICDKYGLCGIVGCFQGGVIYNTETNEKYFEGGLSPDKAKTVLSLIKGIGVPVLYWTNDTLVYEEESFYTDMYKNCETVKFRKVENIIKSLEEFNYPVSKVCAVCEEGQQGKIYKTLGVLDKSYLVNSGSKRLIEVVNSQYNKGFALKYVAKLLGVSLDKVIAVGDSTNDIELLNGEWHGVAVGDGEEELKKVAKEITVCYKDKPIKVLLEKYCL